MELVKSSWYSITSLIDNLCKEREPWQIFFIACGSTYLVIKISRFFHNEENLHSRLKKFVFTMAQKLPSVREKIKSEMEVAKKEIHDSVVGKDAVEFVTRLPPTGLGFDNVLVKLKDYKKKCDGDAWKEGWVSGCVYSGADDLTQLGSKVYEMFAWTNPLHPDVFPDVRQMEAEIVRMCCTLFNGDNESCGTTSSGGTESLLLACHAYRNLAYSKGIKNPEIIASINVHAAIDKAAGLFRMRLKKIPLDPATMKVDVKKMKRAISRNTCMLIGSAPEFPYGQIDPMADISQLGLRYKIPVHVDACLGGFLLPFMEKAGFALDPFDFRLPGVTSISCDTHKYGFAGKGISVIMYRNAGYRKHQYCCVTDWRGGIYATATLAGSRGGAVISICWATMMYMGEDKYVTSTRDIITTARNLRHKLGEIKEIRVVGDPLVSVVAIESDVVNIFQLSSALGKKGWHLTTLQSPPGLQIMVTLRHTLEGVVDRLARDIKECVDFLVSHPDSPCDGQAKIYGMAQNIPDQSLIDDVAIMYLDALYSTENCS